MVKKTVIDGKKKSSLAKRGKMQEPPTESEVARQYRTIVKDRDWFDVEEGVRSGSTASTLLLVGSILWEKLDEVERKLISLTNERSIALVASVKDVQKAVEGSRRRV